MMKKVLLITLVLIFVATSAFAVISTSKHNLTAAGGQTTRATSGNLSSCQFCHTPHHAVVGAGTAPLWNRSLPGGSYTLYGAGFTLASTTVNQPGANSLTCLSCHDGTVSIGDVAVGTDETTFVGNVVGAGDGRLSSASSTYFGTSLTREHPVGVVYITGNSAGLNTVISGGTNPTINNKKWKIYGGGAGTGRVECGSCHDPHNTTAGETPFLKDTRNTMCSDCHSLK